MLGETLLHRLPFLGAWGRQCTLASPLHTPRLCQWGQEDAEDSCELVSRGSLAVVYQACGSGPWCVNALCVRYPLTHWVSDCLSCPPHTSLPFHALLYARSSLLWPGPLCFLPSGWVWPMAGTCGRSGAGRRERLGGFFPLPPCAGLWQWLCPPQLRSPPPQCQLSECCRPDSSLCPFQVTKYQGGNVFPPWEISECCN